MIAELHIQTALRNGHTYLKKSFYTPPFKVADITEDKRAKELQLMLMNSSPGVLDGDVCRMKIELEENSSVQLKTQSYQRLFEMRYGASQYMEVHMAGGSSFRFLPHPVVPHRSSCFSAKSKIYLSDKCSLLWGEVLTCGRKLNNEIFQFSKYHSTTEIYQHGKLVVKENLLLQPSALPVHSIGQMEGYTHSASLIYLHGTASIQDLSKTIMADLSLQKEMDFGISFLPLNGLIVRLLGHKGEQLYDCLMLIAQQLSLQKPGAEPQVSTAKIKGYAG